MRGCLVLLLLVVSLGCASTGPRHVATVSVVSAHQTLAMIQDTEALVVCGAPTAAPPPQCLTLEQHQAFAAKLATAFELDRQLIEGVRTWPAGSPVPANVTLLLTQLKAMVADFLASLPQVPQTEKLRAVLGGVS